MYVRESGIKTAESRAKWPVINLEKVKWRTEGKQRGEEREGKRYSRMAGRKKIGREGDTENDIT